MMSAAVSAQSIQPKHLFTMPHSHSRRTSIRPQQHQHQPLLHQQQQPQPMIPITQMILMIFQSLNPHQKKDLIKQMNQLTQIPNPTQTQPQPQTSNNNTIPAALAKATNKANFLPNNLKASRSIPVDDLGIINNNKKGSVSFV
ncbi:MAG: hypothetical protein GY755_14900, partial [Chloroflexi bacterium]|nr:hypothetical protein [Chloroflexota bacterium]